MVFYHDDDPSIILILSFRTIVKPEGVYNFRAQNRAIKFRFGSDDDIRSVSFNHQVQIRDLVGYSVTVNYQGFDFTFAVLFESFFLKPTTTFFCFVCFAFFVFIFVFLFLASESFGDDVARGEARCNWAKPWQGGTNVTGVGFWYPINEFEVDMLNELSNNADGDRLGIPHEQQIHVTLELQMGLHTASGMSIQPAWNHSWHSSHSMALWPHLAAFPQIMHG